MASEKQKAAARSNVKRAQAAAKSRQTLKRLPAGTRSALGKEANKVARPREDRDVGSLAGVTIAQAIGRIGP
jgi:hypothetical protein